VITYVIVTGLYLYCYSIALRTISFASFVVFILVPITFKYDCTMVSACMISILSTQTTM